MGKLIKNIIFDIGNVLLDFNPEGYLRSKIEEERIEQLYKDVFRSEEWIMLDRGTITERQAKENIIKRSSLNEELINKAFDGWYDILTPIEENVSILKKLSEENYKIYYLSNFHLAAFRYVNTKYDFFNEFDGGVVSFEEKLLKPEAEIYEKIIDRYDLELEETLFIDDTEENINAAKKIGIKTIHLKSQNGLLDELKKYNILV